MIYFGCPPCECRDKIEIAAEHWTSLTMMSLSGLIKFRHAISGYARDLSADDFKIACIPVPPDFAAFPVCRMRNLFAKLVAAPVTVTSVSVLYFLRYPRPPTTGPVDSEDELFTQSREDHLSQLPTKAILRGLFVHSFCTHARLVDLGIYLMKSRPRSNSIFDSLIRHTFFAQFCG